MTAGNLACIFLKIFLEAPQKWLQHFSICQWWDQVVSAENSRNILPSVGQRKKAIAQTPFGRMREWLVLKVWLTNYKPAWFIPKSCLMKTQLKLSLLQEAQTGLRQAPKVWGTNWSIGGASGLAGKHQHGSLRLLKVYFWQLLSIVAAAVLLCMLLYYTGGRQHIPFDNKDGPVVVVVIFGK